MLVRFTILIILETFLIAFHINHAAIQNEKSVLKARCMYVQVSSKF